MEEVRIRVLGGTRLQGPSGEKSVGSLLAERLLGALVAAGGAPITLERFHEILWPGQREHSQGALRMAVLRLRQRLAQVGVPDGVTGARGAYRLTVPPDIIDTEVFTALVGDARRLADVEPDRASALLEGALALWRGEPFGALANESWARGQTARLSELRRGAEEHLAELDLVAGRESLVVSRLSAAADAEPYRERRWVQLATALYRLGRQTEALRAVDRAGSILREELGVEPGDELRTIERALLTHDATLMLSRSPRSKKSEPPQARLVGRDADIVEVRRLLEVNRVVTVHGLGGVGKSALGRAVAHGIVADDRTVATAALDGLADPDAVWLALALAAGIGGAADPEDLPAAIASRLLDRPTLVVLDGAESAAETAAEVIDSMILLAPATRFLVTSRVPLGATGEVRYTLDPLIVETHGHELGPAVQLFLDRAGVAPCRLDAEALEVATEMCRSAGGLPLAIELAAAAVDRHDLVSLNEPAALVNERTRDVVRAAVHWSLDVLPESSGLLFARSSLLPDGMSSAAAAHLAGVAGHEVRRVLAPLVQTRLLQATRCQGSSVRYRSLEPIRMIAADLLGADSGDPAGLAFGHLLGIFAAVGDIDGAPNLAALPAAEQELGNVRHWLRRTLGTEAGLELAVAATRTLAELGLGAEGARWLRQHQTATPDAPPLLSARAATAVAAAHGFFAVTTIGVGDLRRAADIAAEHEDWRLWASAIGHLGIAMFWSGDVGGALALLADDRIRSRVAALDDPWLDVALSGLNSVELLATGQFAAAREGLQSTGARFLALGDASSALQAIYVRAWLARATLDMDAVATDLAQARELATSGGGRGIQALIAAELAHLARVGGDSTAPSMLTAAITDLELAGNIPGAAALRRDLGMWLLADGETRQGLAQLRAALPPLLRHDRRGAGVAVGQLAVSIGRDRPQKAAMLAGASRRLLLESTGPFPAGSQRDRIEDIVRTLGRDHPVALAEGAALNDAAVIELAMT